MCVCFVFPRLHHNCQIIPGNVVHSGPLSAERLKNQKLQTELDQVQQDRSTKNYSYLSQQKSLNDLKEKNSTLQKKLDKTQEEISAQTEVILEKMETIDNLQKNSTEGSYLAICRENVDLKRSNKELEAINAVLSPAAKEIRKIRNSLIAKIQLGSRETDENEHENMLKLDILSLFQKYEKSVALHEIKTNKLGMIFYSFRSLWITSTAIMSLKPVTSYLMIVCTMLGLI